MGKSLHTREYKALTALLLEARKQAGLTQQQVADRLRKPQSYVAKYEGGERRLDVIEFLAVCRVLRAKPAEIISDLTPN
jgi:transcriptional regulator with XRE-family HTH domain